MESLKEDVGLAHLRLGKDVNAAVAKRATGEERGTGSHHTEGPGNKG